MPFPKIKHINENSLIIYFGDKIEYDIPAQITRFMDQLKTWPEDFIIDLTPSYASLLVQYNVLRITGGEIYDQLMSELEPVDSNTSLKKTRRIVIPVFYSPESGLDLLDTAERLTITIEQLIELHSRQEYTVFALGFSPGFAFMGIVDEKLRLPRLDTPRTKVPANSVAIAEKQTCIYPSPTPGGWRLLGRTPVKLFDKSQNPPTIYQIGDTVKFEPISREDYISLGGEI